jgi:hypothetical protein
MAFNLLVAPQNPPGLTAQKIPDKPGQPFSCNIIAFVVFLCLHLLHRSFKQYTLKK